jgi:hypothetical protein
MRSALPTLSTVWAMDKSEVLELRGGALAMLSRNTLPCRQPGPLRGATGRPVYVRRPHVQHGRNRV